MRMRVALIVAMASLALDSPAQAFVCGNALIEPSEECDDANATDGDGCSALCMFECGNLTGTWESYWSTTIRWNLVDDGAGGLSGSGYLTNSPGGLGGPLSGTRSGTTLSLFWTINGGGFTLTGTVDACGSINLQPFGVTYRLNTLVCGDGRLDAGEVCDDGNFANGDSCTIACSLAECGNGIVEPGEECDDGNPTNGDGCSNTCARQACGNGTLEAGEECDDGNLVNGDGCSPNCWIQDCGNAIVESGEECEDGNLADGDGCSPLCMFECGNLTGTWESYWSTTIRWNLVDDGAGGLSGSGYLTNSPGGLGGPLSGTRSGTTLSLFWTINGGGFTLTGTVDACGSINLQPFGVTYRLNTLVCGDGRLDAGEVCDDGNFANGDSCTIACSLAECGNGIVEPGEECDDGNPTNGDGCSNTCARQACGNGTLEAGEECDDGNLVNGDGCSPNLPDSRLRERDRRIRRGM